MAISTEPGLRRPAVLVFALALALRLAAIWLTDPSRTAFGDAQDYLLHAERLCADGAYPERGNNYFFRAPGLPVFIAAVTACRPGAVAAVKVGLAAVDALTAAVITLLAALVWGRRRVAVTAGALAAVHPVFLLQVCDVRSEPLFMCFLTVGLALSLRAAARGRPACGLLAGLACGLAALTRPAGLLAAPLLAAALLARSRATSRVRLQTAAALVLGAVLCIAPWSARNAWRYGELLPVNDAFGINLWRGATPSLRAVLRADGPRRQQAQRTFERAVADTARQVDARATTPGARSREWRRLGMAEIRKDPVDYLAFALRRLVGYWRPWLDPRFHRPAAVAASAAVLIPLLAAALAGLGRLRSHDPWIFAAVLAFLILGWLAHVPFQTVMRFRVPFTDPVLLALAARPAAAAARWLRGQRWRSGP